MGCGCGGGQVTSPLHNFSNPAGVPAASMDIYVVTFPNGSTQEFDYEADAYRAIRLTGGGVARKPR